MKRFMQDLGDLAGLDIATRRAPFQVRHSVRACSDDVTAGANAGPAAAIDRCRAAVQRVLRNGDLTRSPVLVRR